MVRDLPHFRLGRAQGSRRLGLFGQQRGGVPAFSRPPEALGRCLGPLPAPSRRRRVGPGAAGLWSSRHPGRREDCFAASGPLASLRPLLPLAGGSGSPLRCAVAPRRRRATNPCRRPMYRFHQPHWNYVWQLFAPRPRRPPAGKTPAMSPGRQTSCRSCCGPISRALQRSTTAYTPDATGDSVSAASPRRSQSSCAVATN